MQIVPAFAYLMPVVILFSVGPGGGRDLHDDLRDPARRAHHRARHPRRHARRGRGVAGVRRDAAQTLFKVQLPLARRQLLLAVNQTIMFALSLVVIAGLIGGRGLGDVVTNGLYSNPALAILAGIAIVIMAIALDRATSAIAERTDPTRRHLTDEAQAAARRIDARHASPRSPRSCSSRARSAPTAIYPDEFETVDDRLHGDDRGHAAAAGSSRCSTTCRTRTRSSSGSPSRSGTSCSSTCSSRCGCSSSRRPGSSCSAA